MDVINVGLSEIKSASSLRDLGAWVDECMTMNKHVSKVCSKTLGALYKINKIRKFLTMETKSSNRSTHLQGFDRDGPNLLIRLTCCTDYVSDSAHTLISYCLLDDSLKGKRSTYMRL